MGNRDHPTRMEERPARETPEERKHQLLLELASDHAAFHPKQIAEQHNSRPPEVNSGQSYEGRTNWFSTRKILHGPNSNPSYNHRAIH